jgi:hypothetical protein
MSHTIAPYTSQELRFVLLTIVNYATGGEAVAATEIPGVTGVDALVMGDVPANQNSLGVPLFPILVSGKIQLFRFTAGAPVEIAPTTGLNAVLPAIVHVTQFA